MLFLASTGPQHHGTSHFVLVFFAIFLGKGPKTVTWSEITPDIDWFKIFWLFVRRRNKKSRHFLPFYLIKTLNSYLLFSYESGQSHLPLVYLGLGAKGGYKISPITRVLNCCCEVWWMKGHSYKKRLNWSFSLKILSIAAEKP